MTSVDQKMSITNKNSKKNDTSLQQMKINEFTINSSVSNKQKSSYVSHMNRNQSDLCSGDENLSRQIDNLPKIATLNDTIPLVTKLNTDERNKISFEFVHKQSTGDTCTNKKMYTNPNRPSLQSCINAHLSNKPPTPPQKVHISRVMIPVSQRLNKSIRSSYNGKSPEVSTHQPRRSRSPKIHCGTNSSEHRSSYMPRPLSADPRSHSSVEASSPPVRLLKPITQQPENESGQEKSHCLARIEYTFYINDTESYQRPFYDRRVEAIARASQCSIFLHKPLPGNKPILYKGMRVYP
ncbi:unnamed protein product [Heterobilharzia americana]|nr:unnamed protein product [Heterobilharzia americana]